MRQGVLALIIVILLVAGLAVGYIGGIANRQTVTTTVTNAVTTTQTISSPAVCVLNPEEGTNYFTVEVSFQGEWNATIKTYSAFETSPTYLRTTCHFPGSNTGYIYITQWNPNGEQTVVVTAGKLDSGDGNLTVSVGWGEAFRSNSTVLPYGSTTAFMSIAP
jgi:hypothetical protein